MARFSRCWLLEPSAVSSLETRSKRAVAPPLLLCRCIVAPLLCWPLLLLLDTIDGRVWCTTCAAMGAPTADDDEAGLELVDRCSRLPDWSADGCSRPMSLLELLIEPLTT